MNDPNLLIILSLCLVVGYLCVVLNRYHKKLNKVIEVVDGELVAIKKAHDINFLNFRDELKRQLQGHNELVVSTQEISEMLVTTSENLVEMGQHVISIAKEV